VNILKSIQSLKAKTTKKVGTSFTLLSTTLVLTYALHAQATPQGNFGITTNNGNRVDVYGDNLPSYKGPVHLWKAQYSSNIFKLGPNQNTGNEIQLAIDPTICITPDVPLEVKPNSGTPLVAKRDCANSYNFKFEGGKIYMGRYPDMCLDVPNNNDSPYQNLQIHTCNGSPAQQFKTGTQINTNPYVSITKQWTDWEYWIVSRKRKDQFNPIERTYGRKNPEVGHAWNAIVKRTYTTYSNGTTDWGSWKADTIFEYNPLGVSSYSSFNKTSTGETFNETQSILDGNTGIFTRGFGVRKARISETRANWIKNNANQVTGCRDYLSKWYNLYSIQPGGTNCNCVDFASRSLHVYSSNLEDFRPNNAQSLAVFGGFGSIGFITQLDSRALRLTPDGLVDSLNNFTNSKGNQFLDNGNTWQ
jgi:hypothetical protein